MADLLCGEAEGFGLGAEGYADVVLAVAAEDESRGDEYTRLIKYPVRHYLTCRIPHPAPEEHAGAVMVIFCSEKVENLTRQNPAAAILIIEGGKPFRSLLQSFYRCPLNSSVANVSSNLDSTVKDIEDNAWGNKIKRTLDQNNWG